MLSGLPDVVLDDYPDGLPVVSHGRYHASHIMARPKENAPQQYPDHGRNPSIGAANDRSYYRSGTSNGSKMIASKDKRTTGAQIHPAIPRMGTGTIFIV